MTNDLTRRTLSKVDKHREISKEWALTRIEPLDQFARSEEFHVTLKEAMQVSQGGNPFIAEYAHQNGWTTAYALKLEVGPVRASCTQCALLNKGGVHLNAPIRSARLSL